jgi:hypothetical protein
MATRTPRDLGHNATITLHDANAHRLLLDSPNTKRKPTKAREYHYRAHRTAKTY